MHILRAWMDFLFGNPRRTLWGFAVIFGLFLMFNPMYMTHFMNQLLEVISPLLTLAIVFFVLKAMVKKIFR
jgi:hypothetical protein